MNMRNHKLKVLSIAMLLLSGCSGSGSTGGTSAVPASAEEAITLENPVRLDQLGVLPASDSSAASFLLQLTNYSKDKYTLTSARAVDLTTGKDSTLVSVASQACSIVSANGSCSIQLTPHTSQSADVKLEVTLKDQNGASRTLFQLIRISGALNANSGGIAMINDINRIVTEDGNYSLSIPVILGESYDDIKASNGSLLCNTNGYQKGSSCTYQVSGKVSGISAIVSTRLEGIKAGKSATVQEANTKIEVAKGAHLLLSHGTKIDDPDTSGEITVFNSGNAIAANVAASVDASSGLKIEVASANPCGTTLAANDSCKVKVGVISTTNGQGSVKVAYKDNGVDNVAQTNVGYKIAHATAGIAFSGAGNNLTNAIVGGKTREEIINVKNTGNRTLEGVSYYLAPAGTSGMTLEKSATNGCNLTSTTLAANESCNLSVKYTPTAAQASKSINLVINGKYTDQNGQSHALVSAQGLVYSASKANSGSLVWTATTGNANFSIINNGIDVESAIWELKNTLALDENLPAKGVSITLNPSTIDGLIVAPINADKCPLTNANIAGDSFCQYKVSYGPTRGEQAQTDVNIKAAYNFYSEVAESSSAKFKVVSSVGRQPKIQVSVTMNPTTGTVVSGEGTLTKPWSFTAYDNKTISLRYTFTNTGTLKADKFNLDSGNLPRGVALKETSCPNGLTVADLDFNSSCYADIDIPDPELFTAPNLVNGNLNSANLKLELPYSYSYYGKQYLGNSDTKHVNFNRLWANVVHRIQTTLSTENAYEFEVQSQVTGLDDAAKSFLITVTPTLTHPIAGVTLTECKIAASEDSCINKISLPKDMFNAGKELLVTFNTSTKDLDPKNAIVSSYSVGSTMQEIHNEAELVAAFQGDTSQKLFTLENDIALVNQWTPVAILKNATFDGKGHKITSLKVQANKENAGMFKVISPNVTVKNLSLEGVIDSKANQVGLLAGYLDGSNITISNSHFKSKVIGTHSVGGLFGLMAGNANKNVKIESVTVEASVTALNKSSGLVGGLASGVYSDTEFKNIRIITDLTGGSEIGGLVGAHGFNPILVKNVNVTTIIESSSATGNNGVGGLIGHNATRELSGENINVFVKMNANDSTNVGGVIGNDTYGSSLSNVLVSGSIKTGLNPKYASISGIANINITNKFSIKNAVDKVTIILTEVVKLSSSLKMVGVNNKFAMDSANVFFILSSPGVFINEPKSTSYLPSGELINPMITLGGDIATTAEEQKTFLASSKGFDFTNTWTIKKVDGVDSLWIKEDSIPQFPQW